MFPDGLGPLATTSSRHGKTLLTAVVGILLGFLYWQQLGCPSGVSPKVVNSHSTLEGPAAAAANSNRPSTATSCPVHFGCPLGYVELPHQLCSTRGCVFSDCCLQASVPSIIVDPTTTAGAVSQPDSDVNPLSSPTTPTLLSSIPAFAQTTVLPSKANPYVFDFSAPPNPSSHSPQKGGTRQGSSHFCVEDQENSQRRICKFKNICFEPLGLNVTSKVQFRYYYKSSHGGKPVSFQNAATRHPIGVPLRFIPPKDTTAINATKLTPGGGLEYEPPYPFVESSYYIAELHANGGLPKGRSRVQYERFQLHPLADDEGMPDPSESVVWHEGGTHVISTWNFPHNIGHIITQTIAPVFEILRLFGDITNVTLWDNFEITPNNGLRGLRAANVQKWGRLLSDDKVRFISHLGTRKMHCFSRMIVGVAARSILGNAPIYVHGRGTILRSFSNYARKRVATRIGHTPSATPMPPVGANSFPPTPTPTQSVPGVGDGGEETPTPTLTTIRIGVNLKSSRKRRVENYPDTQRWLDELNGQSWVVDGRRVVFNVTRTDLSMSQTPRQQITRIARYHIFITTAGSGMYYGLYLPENSALLHFPPCAKANLSPSTWNFDWRKISAVGAPPNEYSAFCFMNEFTQQSALQSQFRTYPAVNVSRHSGNVLVNQAVLLNLVNDAVLHVLRASESLLSSEALLLSSDQGPFPDAASSSPASSALLLGPASQPTEATPNGGTPTTTKPTTKKSGGGERNVGAGLGEQFKGKHLYSSHFCVEEYNAGFRMCRFQNLCLDVSAKENSGGARPTKRLQFLYYASEAFDERLSTEWQIWEHDNKKDISQAEYGIWPTDSKEYLLGSEIRPNVTQRKNGFVELGPRGAVHGGAASFASVSPPPTSPQPDFYERERLARNLLSPQWIHGRLPIAYSDRARFKNGAPSAASASASIIWMPGRWVLNNMYGEEAGVGQGRGPDARVRAYLEKKLQERATGKEDGEKPTTNTVGGLVDWLFFQGEFVTDSLLPVFELLLSFNLAPLQRDAPTHYVNETRKLTKAEIQYMRSPRNYRFLTTSDEPVTPSSSVSSWMAMLQAGSKGEGGGGGGSAEASPETSSSMLQHASALAPGKYCFPELLVGTGMRGFSGKRAYDVCTGDKYFNCLPHGINGNGFPDPNGRGTLVRDFRNYVWSTLPDSHLSVHPKLYQTRAAAENSLTILLNLDPQWVADPQSVILTLRSFVANKWRHKYTVKIELWNREEPEGTGSALLENLRKLAYANVFITTAGVDASYAMFMPDYSAVLYLPACFLPELVAELEVASPPSLAYLYNWQFKHRIVLSTDTNVMNGREKAGKEENEGEEWGPKVAGAMCVEWELKFLQTLPSLHVRTYSTPPDVPMVTIVPVPAAGNEATGGEAGAGARAKARGDHRRRALLLLNPSYLLDQVGDALAQVADWLDERVREFDSSFTAEFTYGETTGPDLSSDASLVSSIGSHDAAEKQKARGSVNCADGVVAPSAKGGAGSQTCLRARTVPAIERRFVNVHATEQEMTAVRTGKPWFGSDEQPWGL